MKFLCPQCNTRYSVPDDNVPADTAVRFTCKTCSNVIRLRRSEGNVEEAHVGSTQAVNDPTVPPVVRTRVTPMSAVRGASASGPSESAAADTSTPSQSTSSQADYLNAAPGEATRVFMSTAGLFTRRRNHRIAAVAAVIGTLLLAVVIGGDLTGWWQIPGMGVVYEVAGAVDPHVHRAIERTESQLARSDLTEEQRQALRDKLMGLQEESAAHEGDRPAPPMQAIKNRMRPGRARDPRMNAREAN